MAAELIFERLYCVRDCSSLCNGLDNHVHFTSVDLAVMVNITAFQDGVFQGIDLRVVKVLLGQADYVGAQSVQFGCRNTPIAIAIILCEQLLDLARLQARQVRLPQPNNTML